MGNIIAVNNARGCHYTAIADARRAAFFSMVADYLGHHEWINAGQRQTVMAALEICRAARQRMAANRYK